MGFAKISLLSMLASRVFTISRRTWLLISTALLTLTILAIWLTLSLAGWLFGMAKEGVSAAPDVARSAVQQVEKAVPGASQFIEDLRSIGQATPPGRDASGTER